MRHEKDRHEKWSRGWLADQLLWWVGIKIERV
jgi:hypothetical protein